MELPVSFVLHHAHQESMFSSHFVVNEKKIDVIIQLIQLLVVAGFVLLHFPDFVNQQVFSYTMLQQSTSLKAIVCCLIIIAGFFMGVDQEGVAGKKYFYEKAHLYLQY